MRRTRVRIVLGGLVAIIAAAAFGSPSRADDDPQGQRDQVRREKAAAAQDVDAMRASAADVAHAVVDLQDNLAAEEAELEAARQAEGSADLEVARAQRREADVQGRIAAIKSELRVVAVRAYVSGLTPFDANVEAIATEGDGLLRRGYLESEAHRDVELVANLGLAENELAAARQEAERNASIAAQKRGETERRVVAVTAARNEQQSFADQVEQRIDQRLYEIQDLSALDRQLSDQITAEEAALAARLPAPVGVVSSPPPLPPAANISLTTVRGITVASSIAQSLDQMLLAASADGVELGGYGYRDSAEQWRLRQQNCANPADSPPFDCFPPTARAGTSMHERGLAIDFTYHQQFISTYDNPGYRWLAANAGRFGFKNLPGEPWHWSTNGE